MKQCYIADASAGSRDKVDRALITEKRQMTDNPEIYRCHTHNYREPCIYLLTVTVEGRHPVLGHLAGDMYTAHIELTPLGEDVRHELYALCDRYPQLRLLQYQIMPDHVHVILQVTERLPKPLGNLFSSWKIACGHAYGRIMAGASAYQPNKADTTSPASGASLGEEALAPRYRRLFSEGYNDSILTGREQLQHMIAYVRDNPRRLLLKRSNSMYFNIHRNIDIAGHRLDAIGNLALLQAKLLAVHCRRHWSENEKESYISHCLETAKKGAVLIGAFVSKIEQTIAMQAKEQRYPLIHLRENGFPDLYKPIGRDFYACAEGHLLLLAPWKYHAGRKAISREQCNALNTMAESIAQPKGRAT